MGALLTVDQLAERLNVSKQRVYNLSFRGLIPKKKIGQLVRFDSEEIDAWLAEGGTK